MLFTRVIVRKDYYQSVSIDCIAVPVSNSVLVKASKPFSIMYAIKSIRKITPVELIFMKKLSSAFQQMIVRKTNINIATWAVEKFSRVGYS